MYEQKLEQLKIKKQNLQEQLSDPEVLKDPQKVKELSIAFSRADKRLAEISRLEDLKRMIAHTEETLKSMDRDERALADDEIARLKKEASEIEARLAGADDLPDDLILEIRAGAGGDEAALFAKNLFEMYRKFAERKDWNTTLLNESKNDLGGYKEVACEISGDHAYKTLRFESGVHRVQRIPSTEKSGRVHTSAASVVILPKAREVDVEIKPQEIKIEFFRSSGPGGQNVNKVETAVRVYHLPTGLIVTSQNSRSQQQNRERAMTLLRSKLLDATMQAEEQKRAKARRVQIGTGDRSEKIRTYNFPQDRVTDHRIKESWHDIESIMEGNIEQVIAALQEKLQE